MFRVPREKIASRRKRRENPPASERPSGAGAFAALQKQTPQGGRRPTCRTKRDRWAPGKSQARAHRPAAAGAVPHNQCERRRPTCRTRRDRWGTRKVKGSSAQARCGGCLCHTTNAKGEDPPVAQDATDGAPGKPKAQAHRPAAAGACATQPMQKAKTHLSHKTRQMGRPESQRLRGTGLPAPQNNCGGQSEPLPFARGGTKWRFRGRAICDGGATLGLFGSGFDGLLRIDARVLYTEGE